MSRIFETKPATRERVPLLIGIMGPSGGGKTYSALRLATGIQQVAGGEIHVIDTEARRALHYAERFTFKHTAFAPPFAPLDYLAAIEHCLKQGAGTIIVDSMSHEHEGPGGVLEMHDQLQADLAKKWKTSLDATNMAAWKEPKAQRRRLINSILQMPCNFIFCFRAKEKVKVATKAERANGGEAIKALGYMPIAGEEFVFEMAMNCLLLPNANGVPTLRSEEPGERAMIKTPEQFRSLVSDSQPLSEELGMKLATWSAGGVINRHGEMVAAIRAAFDLATLEELIPALEECKTKRLVTGNEYKALRSAYAQRKDELSRPSSSPSNEYVDPDTGEISYEREPGEEG